MQAHAPGLARVLQPAFHKVIHKAESPGRPRHNAGRITPRQGLPLSPHQLHRRTSLNPPDALPTISGHVLHVAVSTPMHSQLGDLLSYASSTPLPPGTLVRVPLGAREVLGVVWDAPSQPQPVAAPGRPVQLRAIAGVLEGIAPLDQHWRRLVAFAARYYQRALGEVALAALPPQLRDLDAGQLQQIGRAHV